MLVAAFQQQRSHIGCTDSSACRTRTDWQEALRCQIVMEIVERILVLMRAMFRHRITFSRSCATMTG